MQKQVDNRDRKSNPNSYQKVTGIAMGELVCPRHGGATRTPITPRMGVCYACAVAYAEPLR